MTACFRVGSVRSTGLLRVTSRSLHMHAEFPAVFIRRMLPGYSVQGVFASLFAGSARMRLRAVVRHVTCQT